MSNYLTIHGNASIQRELGQTSTGKSVFTFSIADTARKQQGDEWIDGETLWVEVTFWDRQAEQAAAHIRNGQRVSVSGRLELERYTDGSGDKRTKLVLKPEEVALNLRWGLK